MIVFKEDENGVRTQVHDLENKIVIQKTYDAEPLLDACAAERQATAGERWGDGRKVGTVPLAILGQFMRENDGLNVARAEKWLRENPHFITFDRFLL